MRGILVFLSVHMQVHMPYCIAAWIRNSEHILWTSLIQRFVWFHTYTPWICFLHFSCFLVHKEIWNLYFESRLWEKCLFFPFLLQYLKRIKRYNNYFNMSFLIWRNVKNVELVKIDLGHMASKEIYGYEVASSMVMLIYCLLTWQSQTKTKTLLLKINLELPKTR